MTRPNILQKVTTPDWLSFSTEERTAGYSIYETQDRFMRESMAERVLRAAGVFAIFVGYVVWFLPDSMTPEYPVMTRLTLSVLCIGTGILLYFFASRGFRKVVHIDLAGGMISLAHVNTQKQSLVGYNYHMEEIESIFVKRGMTETALACLHLRVVGMPVSLRLLHGLQDELEDLHALLCRDIHSALDCAPRRVSKPAKRPLGQKTPRPGKRRKHRKRYAVAIPAAYKVKDNPVLEPEAPPYVEAPLRRAAQG